MEKLLVPFVVFAGVNSGANTLAPQRCEQVRGGCTSQLRAEKEKPDDLTLLLVKDQCWLRKSSDGPPQALAKVPSR